MAGAGDPGSLRPPPNLRDYSPGDALSSSGLGSPRAHRGLLPPPRQHLSLPISPWGSMLLLHEPLCPVTDCGAQSTAGVAKPCSRGPAARERSAPLSPAFRRCKPLTYLPCKVPRVPVRACGPVCLPRGRPQSPGPRRGDLPAWERHAGASATGLSEGWSLGSWHENAARVRSPPARSALESRPGWAGLWSENPDLSPSTHLKYLR